MISGGLVADHDDNIAVDAYQVTNKAMEMYKKKLFDAHPTKIDHVRFKQKINCFDEMVDEVETKYLLIPVSIQSHSSPFGMQVGFPPRNRPDSKPEFQQTLERAKAIISQRLRERQPFVTAIADFHLLLFFLEYQILGITIDFPALARGIKKKDVKAVAGLEPIIRGAICLF